METFYHQIGYAFCWKMKHSPSELVSFRPGMRVQVDYCINFVEMEERKQKEIHILSHFPPSHIWFNTVSIMVKQTEAWRC